MRDDPVIVLGMHHSGTSIFAELLHRHGVFMDPTRKLAKGRYESKFFIREINGPLLGGETEWARLPVVREADLQAQAGSVRETLDRDLARKYERDGYDGRSPWGWKDPRTCLTLAVFQDIFPAARLLHIVRDEDDVIESLVTRSKVDGRTVTDQAFWRDLRREYVERARQAGRRWPSYHEFTYEDFCQHPTETTRPIFEKLGLDFSAEVESFLTTRVYANRIGKTRPAAP